MPGNLQVSYLTASSLGIVSLELSTLTATTVNVTNSLAVSGSATLHGSLLLASDNVFSITRTQQSSGKGHSTVLLGQSGQSGSTGGDIVIDAGTGATAGSVIIGANAQKITLGSSGHTVSVQGQLAADSLRVEQNIE